MLPSFWRSPSPPGSVYPPWQWLGQCWPPYWDVSWILHQEAADWEGKTKHKKTFVTQNYSTRGQMFLTILPDGGTTVPTNIQYLQLHPWPNHTIHCVNSYLIMLTRPVVGLRPFQQFDKSICMLLWQWIQLCWQHFNKDWPLSTRSLLH